jgi:hypothetical protein
LSIITSHHSSNNEDDVRQEWERIKFSYEILTDKRLRKKYDRHVVLADPQAALQRAALDAAANAATGLGKGLFSMGVGLFSMGAKVVSESVMSSLTMDSSGNKDDMSKPQMMDDPSSFPAFFNKSPLETVQDDTTPNAKRPEAIGLAAMRRSLELPMFFGDRKVHDTGDTRKRRTELITNMGFTRSHSFKTPALFSTNVEETTTKAPGFIFFGFTKADIKLPNISFLSF